MTKKAKSPGREIRDASGDVVAKAAARWLVGPAGAK